MLLRFGLKNKYPLLILAHFILGILVYLEPGICRFYSLSVFVAGCSWVVINRNANHETLFVSAYILGAEVLFRMLGGASYEFAKYTVFIFTFLGIFYSGISKKSWPYMTYLMLLAVSLLASNDLLNMDRSGINIVVLDISGAVSLGFLSIYAFGKKISFAQMLRLLLFAALPAIVMATNVFLQNPDTSEIGFTISNWRFSAMYGPNQVCTMLGLGMFLFFTRAILNSGSRFILILNLAIGSFLAYVGLLTFSRGGMIAGFCAAFSAGIFAYFRANDYGRSIIKKGLLGFVACFFAVFTLVNYQTHDLLAKRYTNRDHYGNPKKDRTNDRRAIAIREVNLFLENPILGVSVTKASEGRMVASAGDKINSHDEFTRLLAEHGSFGILSMLILLLTPVWLFFYKRQNVCLGAFFIFWFLTVNHSGMRLVAPAFFYALMLMEVDVSLVPLFTPLRVKRPVLPKLFSTKTVSNSI